MAELTHFYAEDNTLVDDSSSPQLGWITVESISGGSLSANTKYLIVARALIGSNSISTVHGFRVFAEGDTTIQTKSESRIEFQQTGSGEFLSYFFVHSFTTDASPGDVVIQTQRVANTVRIDQMSLFLLDLDAIGTEGTDYYEDIQAVDTGTEYSTSTQTTVLAQLSGSDLGTDEFLILGCARADIGSTNRWYNHSLHLAYDASSAAEASLHQAEGEDTTEQRITGFAARHQASSGTPNVTIYGQEQANNANCTDGGAYLIALPTTLFADFEHDYELALIQVDATETTVASVGPYTPSVNGNHLIFGRFQTAGTTATTQLGGTWVEEGTTEIRTGDSTPTQNQMWDTNKDEEQAGTFQRYSISSQVTLNLRALGAAATYDAEDRWLIVVNLNEPAVAAYPPFPRRQLTTVRM